MKGGVIMNIGKTNGGGFVVPQGSNLPGCGDSAKINCSGSACNSQNNNGK